MELFSLVAQNIHPLVALALAVVAGFGIFVQIGIMMKVIPQPKNSIINYGLLLSMILFLGAMIFDMFSADNLAELG